MTADTNVTVGSLAFDSSYAYAVAGAGTLNVQVSSGGASISVTNGSHTISCPVSLASSTEVNVSNASSTLTFGGSLSANPGVVLTKSGSGAMTIAGGANVNLTQLSATAGTLTVAAGASGSIGALTVSGGALNYNGATVGTLNAQGGQVATGPGARVASAAIGAAAVNTQGNSLLVGNTLTLSSYGVTLQRLSGSRNLRRPRRQPGQRCDAGDGRSLGDDAPRRHGRRRDRRGHRQSGPGRLPCVQRGHRRLHRDRQRGGHLGQCRPVPLRVLLDLRRLRRACKILSFGGGTDDWQKAGIMARNSTDANAAYEYAAFTSGNGTVFQWRDTAGASAGWTFPPVSGGIPAQGRWLRLVRAGSAFTAYTQLDGDAAWTIVGQSRTPGTPLNNACLIGLAVTSHSNSELSTATFSDVSFLRPDCRCRTATSRPRSRPRSTSIMPCPRPSAI